MSGGYERTPLRLKIWLYPEAKRLHGTPANLSTVMLIRITLPYTWYLGDSWMLKFCKKGLIRVPISPSLKVILTWVPYLWNPIEIAHAPDEGWRMRRGSLGNAWCRSLWPPSGTVWHLDRPLWGTPAQLASTEVARDGSETSLPTNVSSGLVIKVIFVVTQSHSHCGFKGILQRRSRARLLWSLLTEA